MVSWVLTAVMTLIAIAAVASARRGNDAGDWGWSEVSQLLTDVEPAGPDHAVARFRGHHVELHRVNWVLTYEVRSDRLRTFSSATGLSSQTTLAGRVRGFGIEVIRTDGFRGIVRGRDLQHLQVLVDQRLAAIGEVLDRAPEGPCLGVVTS